ncbi:MAG TPA: alpha-amylase family glycosyl hydrolase [Candidatus Hydrogenedentes bacterium]|nr:alpha-amylase family glycosyl hydrolase [Candidatus Hydrogenedentota bacterium]HQH53387.1 alpha-amylase family glycosyl hydrolase [Candidatus Hydrogenedentota bacterium]
MTEDVHSVPDAGQENRLDYFLFGLHLSRRALETFQVQTLFQRSRAAGGRNHIQAVQELAYAMNTRRALESPDRPPVRPGLVLAAAFLEELLRYLIDVYCLDERPNSMGTGLSVIDKKRGKDLVKQPLSAFLELYPPHSGMLAGRYSSNLEESQDTDTQAHYVLARESILLELAMNNPAAAPLSELFDDTDLKNRAPYRAMVAHLEKFYEGQPPFTRLGMPLFACLRAPILASPYSIEGQLQFIRTRWRDFLPARFLERLSQVEDVLKEETFQRGMGPGPARVLEFRKRAEGELWGYPEPERFTADRDWMANVALIAKSVYVWLDQLSKKYGRSIKRLDQIPDEELDTLARWGFTGLWLIGIWERSVASQTIKERMGNPEAAASAYSLYDYVIAADLGGPEAAENLRHRASLRGIHLACDMVPNHVGIFSRWVIEHPHWFLQRDHPPFPVYRFSGPNLSPDPRVSIYIEDGYWQRRDAAVVFKRVDNQTGETRYIYHGNDGTSMPWNDTAQLNYLLPEVRDAVINTIMHVARCFPIIRFDAAMTLAKRHYQRLWFPMPGEGGAIPSRSEYSMSRAEFDQQMPQEFWRELVDRVNEHQPDTLLLAEAFWLMEGYFVRTLGMHRVYNSAFMNMLKMEENSKYRQTVKNVLEFSPQVLKRFVNFQNNPDELTAIEQFGSGDKYFGVAVMLVTMPGLPMFGHGQIEGFSEKYGMEYRRAYWNELVNQELVSRHEREIFPLLRKRYLFSSVENFAFFDFETYDGYVDENVFAYVNRAYGERALVLYNNAYQRTRGRVRMSTAINVGSESSVHLVRRSLSEALGLRDDADMYYVCRDHTRGLEHIYPAHQLAQEGLHAQLDGYQNTVLLDFREVRDIDGSWAALARELHGRGVPNMNAAYRDVVLKPLRESLHQALRPALLKALLTGGTEALSDADARHEFVEAMETFLCALQEQMIGPIEVEATLREILKSVDAVHRTWEEVGSLGVENNVLTYLLETGKRMAASPEKTWAVPALWAVLAPLGNAVSRSELQVRTAAWMDEWPVASVVFDVFRELGLDHGQATLSTGLIKLMIRYSELPLILTASERAELIERMFADPVLNDFLFVNEYEKKLWFSKEQLEKLLYWLFFCSVVTVLGDQIQVEENAAEAIHSQYHRVHEVLAAAETVKYDVALFLEVLC